MSLNPSTVTDNLIALAVGAALASLLAAIFLVLYRLLIGRHRSFWRDVLGTTMVALAGASAISAAGFVLETGGSGSEGLGGAFNGYLAAAAAVLVFLLGLRIGRWVAGTQRSIISDVVPFVVSGALGVVCVGFLQLLSQFS
jgi:hypothetical protein